MSAAQARTNFEDEKDVYVHDEKNIPVAHVENANDNVKHISAVEAARIEGKRMQVRNVSKIEGTAHPRLASTPRSMNPS